MWWAKMKLQEFKDYLKINIDSKNSQQNYFSQMNCFFKEFTEFNQDNINTYLANKIEVCAKGTFNVILASINQYAKFSKIDVELPKYKAEGKKLKSYLTEDELHKDIIKYFPHLFSNCYFNMFVVRFLFYTGLRPSEMVNLLVEDINLEECYLIIKNPKDKDDKKIPFPVGLKDEIQKYMGTGKSKAFDITYENIKYIFIVINKMLKLNKKVTSYSMRHSYAHFCLDNGVSVEKLQILMGHSELKTTMIYAQPHEEDAIKSYQNNIKIKKEYL
jgi:integrase/recombinase XerD